MAHHRLIPPLAVLALLLGGTTPATADSWQPPVTIGPGGGAGDTPSVAVSNDGQMAVAAWSRTYDLGVVVAAVWRASTGWGPAVTVGYLGPDSPGEPTAVVNADGSSALVVWDYADEGASPYYQVKWVHWTGTAWTPSATLTTGQGSDVAMAADGTAIASWAHGGALGTARFHAGTWAAPVVVPTSMSTAHLTSVDIAEDASAAVVTGVGQGVMGSEVHAAVWDGAVWAGLWQAKASAGVMRPQVDLAATGTGGFLAWASGSGPSLKAVRWNGSTWGSPRKLGRVQAWDRSFSVASSPHSSVGTVSWAAATSNRIQVSRWTNKGWRTTIIGSGYYPQAGFAGGRTVVLWRRTQNTAGPVLARVRTSRTWRPARTLGQVSKWHNPALGLSSGSAVMVAVWDVSPHTVGSVGTR